MTESPTQRVFPLIIRTKQTPRIDSDLRLSVRSLEFHLSVL